MRRVVLVLLVFLALFSVGCETELGHEDHDHDKDGVQDHAAENHVYEPHEEDSNIKIEVE